MYVLKSCAVLLRRESPSLQRMAMDASVSSERNFLWEGSVQDCS